MPGNNTAFLSHLSKHAGCTSEFLVISHSVFNLEGGLLVGIILQTPHSQVLEHVPPDRVLATMGSHFHCHLPLLVVLLGWSASDNN